MWVLVEAPDSGASMSTHNICFDGELKKLITVFSKKTDVPRL